MKLCVLFLLTVFAGPVWAADLPAFPDVDLNNYSDLKEATRVLEEEIKLAGRPQTYVVIDLITQTIQIKGHAIALHHISIQRWWATSSAALIGTFRLLARPPIVRRKIDPTATLEQEPISLADMPIHYSLRFVPSLTVEVLPPPANKPLLWSLSSGWMWGRQLKDWLSTWLLDRHENPQPYLRLTLSAEEARSFAWALVDGMSVVIRRPTDQ